MSNTTVKAAFAALNEQVQGLDTTAIEREKCDGRLVEVGSEVLTIVTMIDRLKTAMANAVNDVGRKLS